MLRCFFRVLMIHTVLLFLLSPVSLFAFQDSEQSASDGAVAVAAEEEVTAEAAEEPELSSDMHVAVQTFEDKDLSSVVAIAGSSDGKFLYTAAFNGKAICSFEIDAETGLLSNKKVQSLIPGAVGIAVSPDQKWVAACAHTMKAVVLFSRDQKTGDLELVDNHVFEDPGPNGAAFPIAVTFSPNSKYVYASDNSGSVHCFQRTDDSLDFLSTEMGEDGCLIGARMLTFDAAGKHLTVACMTAGTLAIFKHNPDDGRLSLVDYAEEGLQDVNTLEGVHGVTACANSKHVYTCSGRFGGDNALTAFEIADDGKWKLVQSLAEGEQLEGFEGGNLIKSSPDGKFVYSSGALSSNIASFKRDVSSGKLTFDRYLEIDGDEDLQMTSGIHISGDNRFVYVGGEAAGCVYVFERKLAPNK